MEAKQLRNFVAIVDCGTITKAAAHIGMVQPALSQQLSQLEHECGGLLLIRRSNGIKLTELGQILYKHSRIVLSQLEQASEDIRKVASGIAGTVTIGLPTTVALPLGFPLLKSVRQRYPQIRLQMFESLSGYLGELLGNYRLDLAVLFREHATRDIAVRPLVCEKTFLLGNCGLTPAVRQQKTCELRDLHDVPLVLPSQSHDLRVLLDQAFARVPLDPQVVADVDSLAIMIAAAREDIACTILPASTLLNYDAMQSVSCRQIVAPEVARSISLCWPKSSPRLPASIIVANLIEELVPQLVNDGHWPGVTLA